MSNYALDLEKVEAEFNSKVDKGDKKDMADFAMQLIPVLIKECKDTRIEALDNLLKK
ncbi:hypothetical protein [Priestia megaterium]|uniref:hypothetical protein n=1 Tax=Priestia megaterium TaxID=1404 RepID=UPI0015D4D8EB|nr:hypothetical protein [Priestia megaterium]